MLEDPRLSRNNVRVPRGDGYVKRPVLSVTIHPDLKKILVSMSDRYWHEALVKLLMK